MRLSTIHTKTLHQINKLTSLQPSDSSPYQRTTKILQPICHEPSVDDVLMTNNTFGSERNDIKPVFTGSKFLSLTEDLLTSHIKLCIHKVSFSIYCESLLTKNIEQF